MSHKTNPITTSNKARHVTRKHKHRSVNTSKSQGVFGPIKTGLSNTSQAATFNSTGGKY
jgi:hypothetical protein